MSWWSALARGLAIFAYFVVFTLWLPSWLLKLDAVASSGPWIRDVITTVSWGVALVAGIVGLRLAQRRGWI